MLMLRTYFGNV